MGRSRESRPQRTYGPDTTAVERRSATRLPAGQSDSFCDGQYRNGARVPASLAGPRRAGCVVSVWCGGGGVAKERWPARRSALYAGKHSIPSRRLAIVPRPPLALSSIARRMCGPLRAAGRRPAASDKLHAHHTPSLPSPTRRRLRDRVRCVERQTERKVGPAEHVRRGLVIDRLPQSRPATPRTGGEGILGEDETCQSDRSTCGGRARGARSRRQMSGTPRDSRRQEEGLRCKRTCAAIIR